MDPSFLPAWRLAELTRGGEIGCLELLEHFIARTERLDGALNAVVVRDFARARTRARQLDQGPRTGPLFGVPMTVKESFDLAGQPSTWGFADRRGHKAGEDALALQRLEAAGAVVFGKTNVPVALADWQSYNPVYGTTVNPWNAAHTPGGSSGGSAAAIAAGLSALEIGSDIGGSIRVPAHFCGLFGHKPTWMLCPGRGHSMVAGSASGSDLAAIGPIARSARDLALALDAIAGPDPVDSDLAITLPPPRATTLRGLRVAVWAEQPGQVTDAETVALIRETARRLAAGGAQVSETARPDFDVTEAWHLYLKLLDAAWTARMPSAAFAERLGFKTTLAADDMTAGAIMLRATGMTHREWLSLNERRHQVRRSWGRFFRDWDVLLCPAFATPALPLMESEPYWDRVVDVGGTKVRYDDLVFWPGVIGVALLPASTAPIGMSASGLPIGVQIVGPLYGDRTTIAAAACIEQVCGGFTPPPGWA